VAALQDNGPLTDAELRQETGVEPHQQVNQICRRLAAEGRLRRVPGDEGQLVNILVDAPIPAKRPRLAGPDLFVENVQTAQETPRAGRPCMPADKSLFIIPCSGTKAHGEVAGPAVSSGLLDLLPADMAERLTHARRRLARAAGVDESEVLPAWRRYTGTLYQTAHDALKVAVAHKQGLLIVSGGYGLVLAQDPIGWYDRRFSLRDWPRGLLSHAWLRSLSGSG
jgi:hypothetical protein